VRDQPYRSMDKDMELSCMITLFMFDDVDVNLLPANAQQIIDTLARAGISRPAYRLRAAHHGFGQHTRGPQTAATTA
jgi:hypothetical protein